MKTNRESVLTCKNCGSTEWHRRFSAETVFKSGPENTVIYVGNIEGQYESPLTCSECYEECGSEEPILEDFNGEIRNNGL